MSAMITDPPSEEELIAELEKMLSRESILTHADPFISQLIISTASPELAVPVDGLMQHPNFVSSGVTTEAILQAAERSSILSADRATATVVPEVKAKRATLILRDVDPSVTLRSVLELLQSNPKLAVTLPPVEEETPLDPSSCCPELSSAASIGSNWFITFKQEEMTQDIAWWLRGQNLGGTPVQVRIKSESTLRLDLLSHVDTAAYMPYGYPSQRYRGSYHEGHRGGRRGGRDGRPWAKAEPCTYCKQMAGEGEVKTGEASTAEQADPAVEQAGCTCHRQRYNRGYRREEQDGGRPVRRHLRGKHDGDSGDRQGWRGGQRDERGGRHRGPRQAGDSSAPNDKIVVVTQSDFPPLCEAVKMTQCGYVGTDFRQHSMKELQSICESLPYDAIVEPPPAVAEAISQPERKQRTKSDVTVADRQSAPSAVFESDGPRRHQWCYDALQKVFPNPRAARPKVAQANPTLNSAEADSDVVGVTAQTPTSNGSSFWVTRQQQATKAAAEVPADLGATSTNPGAVRTCWSAGVDHLKHSGEQPKDGGKVNFLTFGALADSPVAVGNTVAPIANKDD